ncbi:MAG: gluconate 2-dehydrogenase subunit 3 family protein [Saprospiraceae bacterium]
MNRRDSIKNIAWGLGYTFTAPAVIAALNGCQPSGEAGWMPTFLTEDQGYAIAEAAERIIPATDTPGAQDVFVHEFIDVVLKDYTPEEDRTRFMAGLDSMMKMAQDKHSSAFGDLEAADQVAILKEMEAADRANDKNPVEGYNDFFTQLKGMTMMGYMTSEQIGEEVLAYNPIPGPYQGCVDLQETTGGRLSSPSR